MSRFEWISRGPFDVAVGSSPRRFAPAFAHAGAHTTLVVACFTLLLGVLVSCPYLPMVDLPQHAAQIAVWQRLADSRSSEAAEFYVNWRTPYLGAYVAARTLAPILGTLLALKVVVWLSAVGQFVAFANLARGLGYGRSVELVGLPLAFGYPFYFGFVSFLFALPFALFALSAALAHAERPTLRSGVALAALLSATLASHGFACGLVTAMIGPQLLRGGHKLWARLWPLFVPSSIAAAWILPGHSATAIGATVWAPRLLEIVQMPALLVASSGADHLASAIGVAILAIVALAVGRPRRLPERWVPLALVLAGYSLFPSSLGGFGPLHPRFAAFLVPALLLAFEPRTERSGAHAAASLLAILWLALFAFRVVAFQAECRPLTAFVERAPPNLRVRPIVFDRNSRTFPGLPALLHLSAYYLVEKGGRQGYSFAMYPTSVVRYLPNVVPGMQGGAEWHPERLAIDQEIPLYDRFLVTKSDEPGAALFGPFQSALSLDFHEGSLWAYRVKTGAELGDPTARTLGPNREETR